MLSNNMKRAVYVSCIIHVSNYIVYIQYNTVVRCFALLERKEFK